MQEEKDTKIGRPTIYSEAMLEKAKEYVLSCDDSEDVLAEDSNRPIYKIRVNLPTVEGLAIHMGINKDTIYEWCKIHNEFSDVIEELLAYQARELINKGLSGDYNPTIAKVLLSKRGYSEKTESDVKHSGGINLTDLFNKTKEE